MKEAILLTGTPGTGKSTIANMLKDEGFPIIDISNYVQKEGIYLGYDQQRDCVIVDEELLRQHLIKVIQSNTSDFPLIIDGHILVLPPEYISKCFVLRCSIKNLRLRLSERNYSSSKIDENIEAEIMEVLLSEALELYGKEKVKVINTDKTPKETFSEIMDEIKKVKL